MEGLVGPNNFSALLAEGFRGRRVLVTGHTGFKGGWLSLWLHELGATVCGLSLDPPSEPNLFTSLGLSDIFEHDLRGDIRNRDDVHRATQDCAPEIVFHLAAQPLVRRSYTQPLETIETNVMGTANVLLTAGQTESVRAVVNITSDKCYENREWEWGYRESDPMGGHDPYSASKGCAELVASALGRSFFTPAGRPLLASVRAGNVIGGGDWGEDRLVPDCIRALSQNKPVVIRRPKAIRPWQHVLEPLSGYLVLGARLLAGDAELAGGWNFGPNTTEVWSVGRIAETIRNVWGDGKVNIDASPQPHEAHWLKLDCSKAQTRLGWIAALDVQQALELTTSWYKAFYGGADAQRLLALTRQQINEYSALRG